MFNSTEPPFLRAARAGDQHAFSGLTEPHRRELQAHCYRLLGSLHDAEDMVQETLLRAWRRLHTFEGRAPFRAWLYKIATNVCFDALDRRRSRRMLPQTAHAPADATQPPQPPIMEPVWLEPFPDEWLDEAATGAQSPEARYAARESVTLAFLTALQLLPPRQRAVLLLRDVLGWRANEVADLLDVSVPAVNSALHRARTTLSKNYAADTPPQASHPTDEAARALLTRYVQAWETADMPGLLALFKEEATLAMPPSPSWYVGREAIGALVATMVFAGDARGRFRLLPTRANGLPAFGVYQQREDGAYAPLAISLVSIADGLIAASISFFDPDLFPPFGLPRELRSEVNGRLP